jgi:hypothetical protein
MPAFNDRIHNEDNDNQEVQVLDRKQGIPTIEQEKQVGKK